MTAASRRPGPADEACGCFLGPVHLGAATSTCKLSGREVGGCSTGMERAVRPEGEAGCRKSFRGAENEKQSLLVDVCKINIGYMTPTGTAGPRSGCHLFFRWLRNDLNLRLGAGPLHDTVLAGGEGAGRQGGGENNNNTKSSVKSARWPPRHTRDPTMVLRQQRRLAGLWERRQGKLRAFGGSFK